MFKKIIITSATASLLVASLAMAQGLIPGPGDSPIKRVEDIMRVLNTFINWMFSILIVVAVIFIIYAAFLYLTAGGDPEKVSNATRQLIYAAVAIGVAFISTGIRFVVEQLLRG